MKLAVIIIGVIALACIALELVSHVVSKREKARWDRMSSEEQRKCEEEMYKRHQMG